MATQPDTRAHAHTCAHEAFGSPEPGTRRPLARRIVVAPILGYKRWLSPGLGAHCRYEPSCSSYAVQAIDQFGILRGLVLAAWRVARCNPLGGQGIDRPEDQRLFPLSARLKRAPID
ncbi:MAG: membrane protein insertion efficiency factor YidD [Patulibacter minatonensis]